MSRKGWPTNSRPRVSSKGTETERILLGKLGLPDSLVGGTDQALQNEMAFRPQGLFGANRRFPDQPKLSENSLIILESECWRGRIFRFPCIHLHLNLKLKLRLLETFNFYLIIRISLQGIYLI